MSSLYPAWILEEAAAFAAIPPTYEASLYGLWTGILTTVFPASEGYIVKPQAPVRAESGRLSEDSYTSTDSYGRSVTREPPLYPDFVVARYLAPRRHQPVLLVELKRVDITPGGMSPITKYVDILGLDQDVGGARWMLAGNSTAHCYPGSRRADGSVGPATSGRCVGSSVWQFMMSTKNVERGDSTGFGPPLGGGGGPQRQPSNSRYPGSHSSHSRQSWQQQAPHFSSTQPELSWDPAWDNPPSAGPSGLRGQYPSYSTDPPGPNYRNDYPF